MESKFYDCIPPRSIMHRALSTQRSLLSRGSMSLSPHQVIPFPFLLIIQTHTFQQRHFPLCCSSKVVPDQHGVSAAVVESTQTDQPRRVKRTGVFHDLPHVSPPDELLASAMKRAKRVNRNRKLVGPAAQARNLTARQMDKVMQELTKPLTSYLQGFPAVDRLHKFEATLLDLTISEERYVQVLKKLLLLRKTLTEVGKGFASRGARADNKKDAQKISEEGFQTLESIFSKQKSLLLDLVQMTRELRRLPKLELHIPTLALVGAPNVGKSSIVWAISSGKPEICNYPFTTRRIQMGHFYVDNIRHQITDTPGLLNRPEDEKNTLELLTIATLRYLPTAVVFVLDATGQCGSSFEDQLEIRENLKRDFPEKLWIDVFSKWDLVKEKKSFVEKTNSIQEAFKVSCITEEGLNDFKKKIMQMYGLSASNSMTESFEVFSSS